MGLVEALEIYAEWWICPYGNIDQALEADMWDALRSYMWDNYSYKWAINMATDEACANLCLLEAEYQKDALSELGHMYFGS